MIIIGWAVREIFESIRMRISVSRSLFLVNIQTAFGNAVNSGSPRKNAPECNQNNREKTYPWNVFQLFPRSTSGVSVVTQWSSGRRQNGDGGGRGRGRVPYIYRPYVMCVTAVSVFGLHCIFSRPHDVAEMGGIPRPHHGAPWWGRGNTEMPSGDSLSQRLQILVCVPVAMSQFHLKFDGYQSLFSCV